MINLLITLLVLVLIFSLVWWVLGQMPVPDPFRWIVNVVLGIIFIIVLLGLLTGGLRLPLLHIS